MPWGGMNFGAMGQRGMQEPLLPPVEERFVRINEDPRMEKRLFASFILAGAVGIIVCVILSLKFGLLAPIISFLIVSGCAFGVGVLGYPREDRVEIIPPDPRVNLAHLQKQMPGRTQIPDPPEVELSKLVDWAEIYDKKEDASQGPHQLPIAENIRKFVKRIQERVVFLGTGPAGSERHKEFYDLLEKLSKHIANYLQQEDILKERGTFYLQVCLQDLADASERCATAYLDAARRCYACLAGVIEKPPSLEEEILQILVQLRSEIVDEIRIAEFEITNVHTSHQIMRAIGKEFALPGQEATYDDPFAELPMQPLIEKCRSSFHRRYTAEKITTRIVQAANAQGDDPIQLTRERVNEFFQKQAEENPDLDVVTRFYDGAQVRREGVELLLEKFGILNPAPVPLLAPAHGSLEHAG